jgi:hypothetical protein
MTDTGLPPEPFYLSRWLYLQLGRLYDTRRTSAPWPLAEFFPCSSLRGRPPYKWIRLIKVDPSSRFSPVNMEICDYNHADFLDCIGHDNAGRIEADRHKVFDMKLRVLERLATAVNQRNANKLWSDCLAIIVRTFPRSEEIEFYLHMDRLYLGFDARDDQGQRSLNRCSGKDFQEEVLVPPATSALHGDAVAAGMLLQQ